MRVFKGCRKGFLRRLLEKKRMCWWQWWEKFTGRMDFAQGLQ